MNKFILYYSFSYSVLNPPTLLVERVDPSSVPPSFQISELFQTSEPQGGGLRPLNPLHVYGSDILDWTRATLSGTVQTFFETSRTIQNLKNPTRCPQQNWFWSFGAHFWHQFSLSSKFIFCNKYNAKCLFWHIKASHFDIKNSSEIHVCFTTLSCTALFSSFILTL